MAAPVNVALSVTGIVDNFTYRVEQASFSASLSICSVATVRQFLQAALQAICGYVPRSVYFRGWGYEYLTNNKIPTAIADDLLKTLINELDQCILDGLGDRPYYNHWYVQLGTGKDVCTLYITRLGTDGNAFGYDGSGY